MIIEISFFNLTSFSRIYPREKSKLIEFRSSLELIGCWPFPSYPSVVVFNIPLKKISNAKMINLLGDQISHYRNSTSLKDNEFFFDYLKKEIKEKRKMGHITILV